MQIGAALVGARQGEQRFQQLRHSVHFLERLLQGGERFGRHVRARDCALDAGAHDGEWGFQLVARVRREAPQRRKAPFQAGHHLIQCLGQPAELVALHGHGEAPVQAPAVGDLPHLRDHPVHRLERSARDPAADQNRGHDPHEEGDHDRQQQLLDLQLRRARIGAREDGAELTARVRHRPHDVMQGRSVGLDPKATRQVRVAGGRRSSNGVELLELGERERARIGRCEQQAPVTARHEQKIRHDLQDRRDFLRQHRPPGRVLLHEHAARVIALGQNARGQVSFRLDAAIEILVGGAAAREIEDYRKDGDAEDERGSVPNGHPRADTLHGYARTTYPTPRTVWISFGSLP